MKIFGIRIAGTLAAGVLGLVALVQPGRVLAQGTASVHGHVQNAAGQPVPSGDVRFTTDPNPTGSGTKYDYTFPVDASGNYKGDGIKPGTYTAVTFQAGKHIDFVPAKLSAGQDTVVDFDMTRKEFVEKMSSADRALLEEYKKKNAETTKANSKIESLNTMLNSARTATKAGNYDEAVKVMTDATTAKPDEAILWDTLADAQLGQANAAAKAARDAKATDASVPEKYTAAVTSYQKAIALNAATAKPNIELAAAANNQLGQTYGKLGKMPEAASAYDAAAKSDPTKAATFYYNEAATLFNANDMDGAAAAADKAIAADPNRIEAYYIKGQSLVQKASVDPKTNKITAPPECVAAYQKYLELAPTGPHAEEVKSILLGIGEAIKPNYKAPKK